MNDLDSLLTRARDLGARGESYCLVTVLHAEAPSSARAGDKALVTAEGIIVGWIGGGCAQPAVLRTVREVLADGRPRHIGVGVQRDARGLLADIVDFGSTCESGGRLELFVDPVLPRTVLAVLGDSPVAQALADLAPRVGFEVLWLGGAGVGSDAAGLRCLNSDEYAAVPAGALVVVATQGRRDAAALGRVLSMKPWHVAFVASRRKAESIRQGLLDGGADAAAVAAIEAPAGHDIGARTPAEIALSVLASLVARRRARPPALASAPAAGGATTGSTAPSATSASESCCGERGRP